MKIAHVCLSLGKGGAEKLLVDNLPYYANQGYDVSVIQFSSILEEPTYIDIVKNAGIKVYSLSKGSFRNVRLIGDLVSLLKKTEFDIIHVHLFPCLYFVPLAVKIAKLKPVLIFTEHNTKNGRTGKKLFKIIEPIVYNQYHKIIAISYNVEKMLKNWLPGLIHKIMVINNGVDIDNYARAKPYTISYFKENFKLQEGSVKLFMTSRFSSPKDQETLIKSLVFLPENYFVFFAGDGDDMKKAIMLTKELELSERVHFLGFRTDIPRLLKSADINILSSLHEGLSGVVLESLASGKPFLGSDVPGINDIVPDKDFLFKKQNPLNLANRILKIMKNKSFRQAMIEKGLTHVNQFDSIKMREQHIILYKSLLGKIKV
jgi:glycosyltransferase involved in cell wall biosynthesis